MSHGEHIQHPTAESAELRRFAFTLAYRMLGTVSEAEDIVQEALLRLHNAERDGVEIESARAYLATVTTRLAVDYLRSARVRRETYPGTWLPEPVVEEREPQMARDVEMAESLSMAFLVLLETLSPVERAVFLLREVFDYEYEEISAIVQKSAENCRQIFNRAKRHIDAGKPRFGASPQKRDELAERFFAACQQGGLDSFVHLLSEDVVFYGDGGGKAAAAGHPVHGRVAVARLLHGIFSRREKLGVRVQRIEVNGTPGLIAFDPQYRIISVFQVDIRGDLIYAVRGIVNPDKLQHLGPVSDLARLGGGK
jgi:RNA polymerase sigma-70 factor (ECF subfamily)